MNPFADPARSLRRSRQAWPSAARAVAASVAAAGVALLAAACGGSPGSAAGSAGSATTTAQSSTSSTSSARSAHEDTALELSRCMRSHGVPSFPDPDAQGNLRPFRAGVSKQTSAAADQACKHLLSSGGAHGEATQGDQQKLAFALNVARCMRSHGFPTYPDPTASSQGTGTRFAGTGINTKAPQFRTAEITCEKEARKALGLP